MPNLSAGHAATQQNCVRPSYPDLTAIRAVFAAWVFAYHLGLEVGASRDGFFGRILSHGYLGVDGFFILSGMVLTIAHPAVPWREILAFWVKRLRRIYPVHLATLLLLLAMLLGARAVGIEPNDPGRFSAREFWLHLTLLQGWGFSDRWAWNYPSWSISTEWAGYLAFPLIVSVLSMVPRQWCWIAAVFGLMGLSALSGTPGVGLNLTYSGAVPRFAIEFVAGSLLARAPGPRSGSHVGYRGWMLGFVVFTGLLCGVGQPDYLVVQSLVLPIGCMLWAGQLKLRPCLGQSIRFLGVRSYAFYMSFAVIETALATLFRAIGATPESYPLTYSLLMTLGTAALAELLHSYVEEPWRSARPSVTPETPLPERA